MSRENRWLVTGANGLVGRNLIRALHGRHEVHALVRTLPERRFANVHYHVIDFASQWTVNKLPVSIDVVVHLAESSRFREFPDQALDVFRVNVESTALLLDYAARAGVEKFIFASSGGVYGSDSAALMENSPISPHDRLGYYLGSKLCGEVLAANYTSLMDILIFRFFFVYGPGQNRTMLIPRLVDNIRTGNPITLQGEHGIRLNPIHVDDAVAALQSAVLLKGSHTFNIAGPDVVSIREIAEIISRKVGVSPDFITESRFPRHLIADITAMKNMLIEPKKRLYECIDSAIPGGTP